MEIKNGTIKYLKNNERIGYTFEINEKNLENSDLNIQIEEIKLQKGNAFTLIVKPKKEFVILELSLCINHQFNKNDKILANGYQSWSSTNEVGINEKLKTFPFFYKPLIKNKHKLNLFGDYTFVKYSEKKGQFHSHNHTYIKNENYNFDFIGSLSEKDGFTIFYFDTGNNLITIKKDCENLLIKNDYKAFELFYHSGDEKEVFEEYFKQLKIEKKDLNPLTGWTSWYNYYTAITEEIILNNLNTFKNKKIPIDVFQIDDGYQKSVGDWLITNDKFPNGMKPIADKIKECCYKAGIWIAPFICEHNSSIFKEHNEWILKDEKGNYVYAGNNDGWSGPFYALDFYNEEFRDYLRKVFKLIITEWGFDFLKLDFLYAVSLIPRKDKTRGTIMNEALLFLKSLVGEKNILGCGVPLGNAFGFTQYCRIGCDVSLIWEDIRLRKINYRERISTFSALNDTIFRRQLNGNVFYNDPDVFFLRDGNIHLNEEQKYTLLLTNLIFGGLVFTSDEIANYDEEKEFLYLSLFPQKNKNIIELRSQGNIHKVKFEIEEKEYLAYINLSGQMASFNLDEFNYFTDGEILTEGTRVTLLPYESMSLYKIKNNNLFEILGTTGHIFPISEIKEFTITEDNIKLLFDDKFINQDEIFIKIPDNLNGYKINGNFLEAEKIGDFNLIIYEKNKL